VTDKERPTILAIDPGGRRYGVAIADLETRFARPLEVIDATLQDPIARIADLIRDCKVVRVVVGRPVALSGSNGPAVAGNREFIEKLGDLGIEVVEHDERLTTVIAEQGLRAGGSKRATRERLRDAVAAQVLLQHFLDSQR